MAERGQPLDVCIDSAGALVGTGIYTTYYIVYKSGYNRAMQDEKEHRRLLKEQKSVAKKQNMM